MNIHENKIDGIFIWNIYNLCLTRIYKLQYSSIIIIYLTTLKPTRWVCLYNQKIYKNYLILVRHHNTLDKQPIFIK